MGRKVSTICRIAGKVNSGCSNICHTWRTGCFTGDNIIFPHSKQDMIDMKHVRDVEYRPEKKNSLILLHGVRVNPFSMEK